MILCKVMINCGDGIIDRGDCSRGPAAVVRVKGIRKIDYSIGGDYLKYRQKTGSHTGLLLAIQAVVAHMIGPQDL